jgi:transposase-like protein
MANKKITITKKMAALRMLDHNGSPSEVAKAYGVSRVAIYNWKKELWDRYKEEVKDLDDYSITLESKKLLLKQGTAELTEKTIKLFEMAVDFFLNDPEQFLKLTGKDKVSLLNTIMPYVVEKKGVINPDDIKKGDTHNNFFGNILNQIKNGDNEDSIRRNIETATVSQDS